MSKKKKHPIGDNYTKIKIVRDKKEAIVVFLLMVSYFFVTVAYGHTTIACLLSLSYNYLHEGVFLLL